MLLRSPRRTAWWIAALLVAALTAGFVARDLARLHNAAASAGVTRPVLVATRDLELGRTVRAGDVAVRRIPARAAPRARFARPAEAVGRVVTVPVLAHGFVGPRHLAPRDRTGPAAVLEPGTRAVRVAALAPPLRAGDRVDVLAAAGIEGLGGSEASEVARAAVVLGDPEPAADGRTAVTLAVAAGEAPAVAAASAGGMAVLATVPPEEG